MENNVRDHASAIKKNIIDQCGGLSKGEESTTGASITEEQFDAKYSVGHEVFEQEGVNAFIASALEKGMSQESIVGEISSLEKVLIKGEGIDELSTRYVRAIQSEDVTVGSEIQEEEG